MKHSTSGALAYALFVLTILASITSCAWPDYSISEVPNYDALIGKKFSDVIFMGRKVFDVVEDSNGIERLSKRRPDGCVTSFNVRKRDDIILSWHITPSPEQCLVRRTPLNL